MVNNLPANAGDLRDVGLTPQAKISPGEGNGNPLQNSCLEDPMDRGDWRATVHSVTKSPTRLSDLASTQVTRELYHLPSRDSMRNKKDTLVRVH